MNLTELVTAGEVVGSSGATMLVWNLWNSHRIEKAAKKADKRNELREPLVQESLELGNAAKVADILRKGIEELEDSKRRMLEEMREKQAQQEDKIHGLINENSRLRNEVFEEQQEHKTAISDLNSIIVDLTKDKRNSGN